MKSSSFARGGKAGPEHILSGTEGRHDHCVPALAPGSNQNICNTAGTPLQKEHSGLSTTHVFSAEALEALLVGISNGQQALGWQLMEFQSELSLARFLLL